MSLVEHISKLWKIKKTGRHYSACCPFHFEYTPSFTVNPETDKFHCFGCGANGGKVEFDSYWALKIVAMEYEKNIAVEDRCKDMLPEELEELRDAGCFVHLQAKVRFIKAINRSLQRDLNRFIQILKPDELLYSKALEMMAISMKEMNEQLKWIQREY